jgi:N,N'-diacetyllegionaminate synthase
MTLGQVTIGHRVIGEGEPVFITAELGKNHLGSPTLAKFLIDKARQAGVDAVKFQTHIVSDEQLEDHVVSPHFDRPRYEWVKENTLPKEWFEEVFDYARKVGLICYSTPMSRAAAELLYDVGVPVFKIGSADMIDFHMLEFVAQTKKPMILSTGMCTMEEIKRSLGFVTRYNDQIVLMHAVSLYPCPPELVNLKAMWTLREAFGRPVGFSDHSVGIHLSIAAVAMGAVCIEKHCTLDRSLPGPDHKISLSPEELMLMVKDIRELELARGDGVKRRLPEEEKYASVFWKCIVSSKTIKRGQVISRDMLRTKRPFKGISAVEISNVVGKKALVDIEQGTPITDDMIG